MIKIKEILLYFIIISLIGTLLHFLYKLTNNNVVVGVFASVNESIWEHVKILITPIFLINTISYILGDRNNYFIKLFIELLLAITLIIALYEIKINFFKNKYNFLNILIYYFSAFIISIVGYAVKRGNIPSIINTISIFGCLIVFIFYLSFTMFPPKNKLFLDPITKTYGINIM